MVHILLAISYRVINFFIEFIWFETTNAVLLLVEMRFVFNSKLRHGSTLKKKEVERDLKPTLI